MAKMIYKDHNKSDTTKANENEKNKFSDNMLKLILKKVNNKVKGILLNDRTKMGGKEMDGVPKLTIENIQKYYVYPFDINCNLEI